MLKGVSGNGLYNWKLQKTPPTPIFRKTVRSHRFPTWYHYLQLFQALFTTEREDCGSCPKIGSGSKWTANFRLNMTGMLTRLKVRRVSRSTARFWWRGPPSGRCGASERLPDGLQIYLRRSRRCRERMRATGNIQDGFLKPIGHTLLLTFDQKPERTSQL